MRDRTVRALRGGVQDAATRAPDDSAARDSHKIYHRCGYN
jgi:hypothetical protein